MSKTTQTLTPVNIGKWGGGGYLVNLFALTLLLAILPSTATAQIWINGILWQGQGRYYYENYDDIADALVVIPYHLYNYDGKINNATVIPGSGPDYAQGIFNGYRGGTGKTGYIETANVGVTDTGNYSANAHLWNGDTSGSTGHITTLNVYDSASVVNYKTGTIETANVYGGSMDNRQGTTETLNAYGGSVINSASIGIASLEGGHITNSGKIGNLTYKSGTYTGSETSGVWVDIWDNPHVLWITSYGSIGTLNIAGDLYAADDWGMVESLKFDSSGNGILHITASAENADPVFATFAMTSAEPTSNLSFSEIIGLQSVDLTYGNIFLDMTSTVSEGMEFTLLDLFDTEEVFGTLSSLSIGEQQFFSVGADSAFIYADGAWHSNEVPEPATLAMVALGLAGLGLARRRRK